MEKKEKYFKTHFSLLSLEKILEQKTENFCSHKNLAYESNFAFKKKFIEKGHCTLKIKKSFYFFL